MAIIQNDINKLSDLLCDDGDYEMQIKNLVIRKANKKSFIKWFKRKLSETKVDKIEYDQYIGCFFSNTVILLNGGEFPIIPKDNSYRAKMGLMLETENDKISTIKFCSLFFKNRQSIYL